MTPPIALIALGIAVPVGIIGAYTLAQRRRREALQQFSEQRGYRFEKDRPGPEEPLAEAFPIFQKGHSRNWGCTITGQVGRTPFTAFDYHYVTGGGKNSQHHRLAMMLWETPGANLPRFSLGPEGFWRRVAQRFGAQDFDFEGDEEFSRGYELQGDDESAVRALFTPARRAYLVGAGPDGKVQRHHLAGVGTRLIWWVNGRLPKPDELDQFFADGDRVRRLFVEDKG